jgi:head-tail adaptor
MKCCDITAGMLTTTVAFERQGAATNVSGDILPGAWAAITGSPTRARVKAASGMERGQVQRTDAVVALKVTVRYVDGLRDSDSVVIRGRRHNITFLDNLEFANKFLVISVDGGVAV